MTRTYLKTILFLILITVVCASYSWKRSQRPLYKSYRKTSNSKSTVSALNRTKPKHVFRDMPTKIDLEGYLKSLQRVVDFSSANRNDIDINFAFGLFFINVNLRTVIRHRHMNIPLLMLQPIRELVKKNTELLNFFRKMVKKDKTMGNKQNKAIYSLFLNDTVWVERVDRYDAVFETEKNRSTFEQLQVMYRAWEQYTKNIFDWERRAIPGPRQSDHCVAALAESRIEISNLRPKCILPDDCYEILLNGTNSGYALTHRLLLMMLARYGRGCSIFSWPKDRDVTTKFCADAYNEAQYIAMHKYGMVDLLMEEIAFCSLEGHVEFLKRTWLFNAIKHQTSYGCFAALDGKKKNPRKHATTARPWTLAKNQQDQTIQGGACNGHLTATAAGAIAGAVRFILVTTKFPQYPAVI